jgi:hypothetical protein
MISQQVHLPKALFETPQIPTKSRQERRGRKISNDIPNVIVASLAMQYFGWGDLPQSSQFWPNASSQDKPRREKKAR